MNFDALKFAAFNAAQTLWHGISYKSIAAAILAILLHKHAVLFIAFSALVFIDCFTRWMSLSYKRLQGMGQTPSVTQIIGGIEAARTEGLISSEVMKHRFVGKVIVYILCVLAAVLVDLAMITLHQPVWAVPLVAGYLVITELLSICENLNDAGIEAVQGLVNIIKKRRG
ncbi:phage holin family protein [Phascolarctobacterium succinatutens]|uniref:phage holin family protein n=1 Tax=Phascolarctobacterium succinatutens TaxID=626940 RepID=UPI002675937C|nr:phage holin family protein [Phascolarctobacterium succinatutens]